MNLGAASRVLLRALLVASALSARAQEQALSPAAVTPPLVAVPAVSAPAADEDATVSTPPSGAAPAGGRVRARPGVVAGKAVSLTRVAASAVMAYEKGKSISVRTPAGRVVKYLLAKGAAVPDDLAAGRTVLVETRVVRKRRYALRVTYAETRVVLTNVN